MLINMFKQKNVNKIYLNKKKPFLLALQTIPKNQFQELTWSEEERVPDGECQAERDLFLWSVLQNQKDLAQITWEQVLI